MTATTDLATPQAQPKRATFPIRRVIAWILLWAGPVLIASALFSRMLQFGMQPRAIAEDPVVATLLAVGYVAFIAGWFIVPAAIGRRAIAAAAGFVSVWLYFHTFPGEFVGLGTLYGLAGSFGLSVNYYFLSFGSGLVQTIALVLVVAAWIFVNSRHPLSYLSLIGVFVFALIAALIAVGNGAPWVFWGVFGTMQTASIIAGIVFAWVLIVAGGAWGAWAINRAATRPRKTPVPAPFVSEQYSAGSYAPGSYAPGSYAPGASTPGADLSQRTNTFAILALVFGLTISVLGIVFGHLAKAQIRRTGEGGSGLATAGLVLGYVSVGLGVIVVLYNLIALSMLMNSF